MIKALTSKLDGNPYEINSYAQGKGVIIHLRLMYIESWKKLKFLNSKGQQKVGFKNLDWKI